MPDLTALVLAGGRGERLRPYTEHRPKPMVLVNGRPLLYYHLNWLYQGGVRTAYILCGYRHQVIQDYFGDGRWLGLELHYVVEDEPLGRGGAIKRGLSLLPPDVQTVIATNGDIITGQPLGELMSAHRRYGGLVTMMVAPLVSPYGVVALEESGRVRNFQEKPALPYWVNAGVYVIDRAIARLLPNRGDHETTTFPAIAWAGKLFGFKSSALWLPVDTIKDLNEASQVLAAHRRSSPLAYAPSPWQSGPEVNDP